MLVAWHSLLNGQFVLMHILLELQWQTQVNILLMLHEKTALTQDDLQQFLTPKAARDSTAFSHIMHEAEEIRAEVAEKMQFIAMYQACHQVMDTQFQHHTRKNIVHQIRTIDTQTLLAKCAKFKLSPLIRENKSYYKFRSKLERCISKLALRIRIDCPFAFKISLAICFNTFTL